MNEAALRGRLTHLMGQLKGWANQYPDMIFPDDVASEAEKAYAEMEDIKGKLQSAAKARDQFKALDQYNEFVNAPAAAPSFPQGKQDDAAQEQKAAEAPTFKGISQLILGDAKYSEWYKSVAPDGRFGEKVRLTSPQVSIPGGIKSLINGGWAQKALVTGASDSSAGAFVFNDVQRNLDQYIRRRPLVMRDIITIATTGSDTIEYVRQVSETNNAAMVPEATSSGVIDGSSITAAMGGLKPESAMTFERVTANVKTVAHWMPATKRALADAGQMQTLIDGFLRYGVDEELEDQMVLGDGTGENFEGLLNISNLTTQAWDTNELVTTRKAKTKVRVVGRATPTAYLLNPYDWETIQLIRADAGGTEGPFMFGGPSGQQDNALWNLPVVECESVPQGTGYVGDFKTLILWDREQTGVQITDSHNDFFVRNLVAILAEARAAFGCLRPASIVEFDLSA